MKLPLACIAMCVSLLICAPCAAQKSQEKSKESKADTKAPVPEKIRSAKTIFLINDTGDLPVYDRFYSELKKWGRFEIVETREKADLVFLLTSDVSRTVTIHSGSGAVNGSTVTATGSSTGVPIKGFHLKIFDTQKAEQWWKDSTEGWWTNKGAVTKLVTNLKKRLP